MDSIIYIVIPCYNEQEVLYETSRRLNEKVNNLIENKIISTKSRIVFVDDGSKDSTWDIIEKLYNKNEIFSGIKLSCNKGHQNALLAGLMTVKESVDAVISMDADLQDDINAIDEMIQKFLSGNDVVYGVRSDRKKDTLFKRLTAETFYKLINSLGARIVFNHADFRLMSKRVLDGLEKFREVNLFLRGMVPMIGFKSDIVYYERHERFAGESKYPLKKMILFAFEGITSLSIKPIRFITYIGSIIFSISVVMILYVLNIYFRGQVVAGWSSVTISIWALGGIQLICLGVIGEYIGKVYLESKSRPRFIVEKYLK